MGKKKNKFNNREAKKFQSMKDNSDNSRNSVTGYMETGNPAEVHAKARAMRNNNNGEHL